MAAHVRRVETLLSPDRAVGHVVPVRRLARPGRAAGRAVERQGRPGRRRHRLPLPVRRRSSPRPPRCWAAPRTRRASGPWPTAPARRSTSTTSPTTAPSAPTAPRCTRSPSSSASSTSETELAGGRAARAAGRQERLPDLDRLRRHAVHHRRAHPDRSPRRRLPAAAGARVPVLALPRDHGRHHDLGAVGLDAARRHHQPGRDDQLQPLRARRGGRLDAPHDRRPVARWSRATPRSASRPAPAAA